MPIWYRFNGRQIGYIGNNGSDNGDYTASIAQRTAPSPGGTPGAFRGGASYGAAYADFDQNYDAINTFAQGAGAQGSGGGVYTVRQGDTLSSIAAQLWGDASLWYKLAEANGLSGDTALTVGQTLSTPAGVNKAGNTAGTFRPYDPSDAYGDTSPTTPKPQAARGNKCGVFGAILLVVIAVAVTVVTSGAAAAAIASSATGTSVGLGAGIGLAFGGTLASGVGLSAIGLATVGAIGAVTGSIVSQGVGVATGLQDKFSWSGVALAAIGGGIGAGLAGAFPGGGVLGAVARGAAGSAITQGIGVATGLQSKFDFVGVAAAGIGAGISGAVGGKFSGLGRFGQSLATNAVGGLANAATRSLVNGTDFGDNILAALPDIIGNTVGGFVAEKVAGSGKSASAANKSSSADPHAVSSASNYSATDGASYGGDSDPFDRIRYIVEPDGLITGPDGLVYGLKSSDGSPLGPGEWGKADAPWVVDENGVVSPNPIAASGDGPDIVVTASKEKLEAIRAARAIDGYDFNAFNYTFNSSLLSALNTPVPIRLNYYGQDRRWDLPDNTPQWKAYTAEDRVRGYERARSNAFWNAGEGGAFGASLALLSGGDPDQIAAAGRLQGVVTDIGAGYAVSGGGGRVTLSASGAAESKVLSPFTERYLTESGGRWGGTATRQQNYEISQELEARGYSFPERPGGGLGPEEYIAGSGSRGGTYVDITGIAPNGRTVRIQTVTTLADGVTPTASEAAAAARIRAAFPNDKLLLVPKR